MTQDVPRAVATGSAGSTASRDRVRTIHVAIPAAMLAAAFCFVLLGITEVPGRAVALFGGPADGVARYGGVLATWQPPAGTDIAHVTIDDHPVGHTPRMRRVGDHVEIELPGVTEANADDVISRLGSTLEFREVIESDAVSQLIALGLASEDGKSAAEPIVNWEQWRAEDSERHYHDGYLFGHDRAALEQAFAPAQRQGWSPPPNTQIVYEPIDPYPDSKDQRRAWRSYFVSSTVEVAGADIANAMGSYDPNTNRPIVLLDFTRDGGRKFGDLTARIAGHKLATLLGGVVKSAPIIESAIRGGRASITMGGGDPREAEHERDVLVETLKAGALTIGGTVIHAHWVAPTGHAQVTAARIGLSVFVGVVAALLAWILIRLTRPEHRRIAPIALVAGPTGFAKRLAWTALGIAIYIAGTFLFVPGINEAEVTFIAHYASSHHADVTMFTVFGLGIAPLVTTFVVVEIVASIVPRWRPLRDTVLGRRKLGLATAIGAIVVSIVQAYFVVKYIEALNRGGSDVFNHHMFWIAVATFAVGPLILAIVASIIGTRGIGNGYAVLLVAIWLWKLPWQDLPETRPLDLVLACISVAAIAAITLAMLGWRVRAPGRVAMPLPSAGATPLHDAGGVLVVIGTLAALGLTMSDALQDSAYSLASTLRDGAPTGIAVVIVATLLWSYVFARPGRRRAQLAKVALEPASVEQWLRAVAVTAVGMGVVFAIGLCDAPLKLARGFYDPAFVVLGAAVIADLYDEWSARERAALIPVWPLHDPLLVDGARDRLAAANIPHHIQATRMRSLLWLFGAYAPMMVLVPTEHAEAAHVLMRDWLQE